MLSQLLEGNYSLNILETTTLNLINLLEQEIEPGTELFNRLNKVEE